LCAQPASATSAVAASRMGVVLAMSNSPSNGVV
jgi:hypothetical protein